MIIRHTTAGADGELHLSEYVLKPAELESAEAELVEAAGGETWETYNEWWALLDKRHRKALRAALWVCLRRADPGLQFQDVSVTVNALTWRYDDEHLSAIWENFVHDPKQNTDEQTRHAFAAMLAEAGWTGTPDLSVEPDPFGPRSDSPAERTVTEPAEPNTAGQ